MTTVTYPDITHKKGVAERFYPNSYRVISEEIPEHESIPHWYARSRAPPLYTEPSADQLPAQSLEPRNNPHAARKVDMVFSDATSFNAPFGIVKTDNVRKEESRWWDWSPPKAEPYGPGAKTQDNWAKTRESSYRNAYSIAGENGPYAKKNTRYSANPYHTRTVGIVPVTDLKPEDFGSMDQPFVEKVSFEQQYNSRNEQNYPLRGKRQGAFVVEEEKPIVRPQRMNLPASAKVERTASMWDLFHPNDEFRGQKANNPYKFQRPLPQIPRADDYGQVWQGAPYASHYDSDYSLERPGIIKQIPTN